MTSSRKAYAFALLAVFFWSTAGSAFKITLEFLHPFYLLLFASLLSFVALLTLLSVTNPKALHWLFSFSNLKKSAIPGLLNPFLYYVVLFQAYNRLPAQEAMALNYLWPVTLVLLSVFLLKQKIGWVSFLAILISFSGTVIIGIRGDFSSFSFSDPVGVLLAAGSSLIWALYWIINMKDKRDPLEKLVLNFGFGTLYTAILVAVSCPTLSADWRGFAGAAYIGLFEMGFTFFFWLLALKYADTTARVSNLIFLSPFMSLIFIRFTVGETILASTIFGLGLIIAGVLIQHFLVSVKMKAS
jgi:drug/metabolite transporter (DMT)-like permease